MESRSVTIKLKSIWERSVGVVFMLAMVGLLMLWLWAEDWLPSQAFWPFARDGIQGAKAAYWGCVLVVVFYWLGREFMSQTYYKNKHLPRWMVVLVAVSGVGIVVWIVAHYLRGYDWSEQARWNEFVRLALVGIPASLVGALQKPRAAFGEEIDS